MFVEFLAGQILGLIFLVIGIIHTNFPPRRKTWGYRSAMSLINDDTWQAANKYSGRLSIYSGIILMIHGGVVHVVFPGNEIIWAVSTLFFLILLSLALIILTERYLRRSFDKEGRRKH